MDAHPRTPDNLEVIRRWEEVRASKWLTSEQKAALRNLEQEHTLLVDEHGNFVLVSCAQVEKIAGAEAPGRAFVFEYQGSVWAAYWHTSGEGFLHMSLPAKQLTLMKTLGAPLAIQTSGSRVKLPLGEKRYLSFGSLTRQDVIAAFASATLFPA
jgi:hypothetical protein